MSLSNSRSRKPPKVWSMTLSNHPLLQKCAAGLSATLIASCALSFLASTRLSAQSLKAPEESSGASVQISGRDAVQARRLSMGVGKSLIIDLPSDAAEIVVGNPKVANAVVRSPRKIYLLGVDNGQTTIFAIDKDGRRIASIELSIGRDVNELLAILKTAMPTAQIDVKTVNDTIILTGSVDSAVDAQKASDIAQAFVGYTAVGGGGGGSQVSFSSTTVIVGKVINSITIRGKDQVMLKVTVAEVQRQAIKQLGVTPNGSWGTFGGFSPTNSLPLNSDYTNVSEKVLNLASIGRSGSIGASVSALERNGLARVLAEPTVTAISGESAKFTAGGEYPAPQIQTCTTTNGVTNCQTSYQYKPYGVTLNFSPVVLSEGRIQLRLATEVTEIDGLLNARSATVNLPAFRTRRHETTVELPSGGSIVSAGLIQQKSRQILSGQPGLQSLPILGAMFRSRDFQNEETELMIIVTPYIAKTLRPDQISRPDDGFMAASDPQSVFLGKVNRIYSRPSNPQIIQNYRGKVGFIHD